MAYITVSESRPRTRSGGDKTLYHIDWQEGVTEITGWAFESEEEAQLAAHLWIEASKNGTTTTQFQHLFGAVLRLLGNTTSAWAKL